MGIIVNRRGWNIISQGVPPDEIAERMNISTERVEQVLNGEIKPDTMFIAASLNSFPMQFHDLYTVRQDLTQPFQSFL